MTEPQSEECMGTTTSDLLVQLETKYANRGQSTAWRLEKQYWETIVEALKTTKGGISYNYQIESVLGVGGAGAVFRVIDCNLYSQEESAIVATLDQRQRRSFRALKVPRPHLERGPSLADSLRDEISRLTDLTHPNVVSLFAKGQVEVTLPWGKTTWPWYVMRYVHDATDLDQMCKEERPSLPQLIRYLYEAALGLEYVHRNGIVHCDFKPGNIFVSRTDDRRTDSQAILADFGYAKHAANSPDLTTIGFTDYFAHPVLQQGGIGSSQGSRTFVKRRRQDVHPRFDLFAFGMTIHYLIENFYRNYTIFKNFSYEIKFLRLCAARLLDGLNRQKGISYGNLPDYAFSDTGIAGTDSFVRGLRYVSAAELRLDLAKLLGLNSPENELPELIETRRENIQVSDSTPTIYTNRLRDVVDHPLVRRLGAASQLGLVSLVYPGATHTRLEHSLGVFGVTAKYLRSLYYDSFDPLFRQIVSADDMKATLLAALFHDIGQYPLAHDLEDVSLEFFSHQKFGEQLLSTRAPEQPQIRLFEDIGLRPAALAKDFADLVLNSWGVELGSVLAVLTARSSEKERPHQRGSHVERLCKSLIDGPIDADKVDYLRRDSLHCSLQYGGGLDIMRLCRCLTVAHNNITDGHLLLVMGVHEKGRISAESILWARYAMLTQVYWHHTMRAIKALLHLAASEFMVKITSGSFDNIQQAFFRCAVLEEQIQDQAWETAVNRGSAVGSIHRGDLRVLGWLWTHSSGIGREAIEHILSRKMFKRLAVIYRVELTENQRRILDRVYSPDHFHDRLRLRTSIEKALLTRIKATRLPDGLLESEGYSQDAWSKLVDDSTHLRCLVDYPAPRPGSSFGLRAVSHWGESPHSTTPTDSSGPNEPYHVVIPGNHFRDGMKELEKSIACLRVYWAPDEHTVIKDGLRLTDIRRVVLEEVDRFSPTDSSDDEEDTA